MDIEAKKSLLWDAGEGQKNVRDVVKNSIHSVNQFVSSVIGKK